MCQLCIVGLQAQQAQQSAERQLQASHSYNSMPTSQNMASHYGAEQLQSASSMPGSGQYGMQRAPQQFNGVLQRPPQQSGTYSNFQVSQFRIQRPLHTEYFRA